MGDIKTFSFPSFISVEEAQVLILENIPELRPEKISLKEASNRFLSKSIEAPISLPTESVSAMDGFAINYHDFEQNLPIKVIGEVPAGSIWNNELCSGEAVKIFTGSFLPKGVETVVIKENSEVTNDNILIINGSVKAGDHVHLQGSQIIQGEVALKNGQKLNAAAMGFLSALGVTEIEVSQCPKVAIIISGSELVSPGSELTDGKIYDANTSLFLASLRRLGIENTQFYYCRDYELELFETLKHATLEANLVIISGGISVGDYDYTQKVFSKLNVKPVFYKVRQKPGKPLYFGRMKDKLFFGIPGNPASALTCFHLYIEPTILAMQGSNNPIPIKFNAVLKSDIKKSSILSVFLKGFYEKGEVLPLGGQSSAMLKSYAESNCLIRLPEGIENFIAGTSIEVIPI